MKQTVQKTAMGNGCGCQIQSDNHQTSSPGIILTLWTDHCDRFLGSVGLGEKGRPAEIIATDSIQKLIQDIESGATVDSYLFDQILGFLVCVDGKSQISTPFLSSHAKTNIWLIDQFFHHNKCVRCSNDDSLVVANVFGMNI
jgi:RNA 3'-terminal phosphate cyclase